MKEMSLTPEQQAELSLTADNDVFFDAAQSKAISRWLAFKDARIAALEAELALLQQNHILFGDDIADLQAELAKRDAVVEAAREWKRLRDAWLTSSRSTYNTTERAHQAQCDVFDLVLRDLDAKEVQG